MTAPQKATNGKRKLESNLASNASKAKRQEPKTKITTEASLMSQLKLLQEKYDDKNQMQIKTFQEKLRLQKKEKSGKKTSKSKECQTMSEKIDSLCKI